jgi:hypothetical protein
MESGRSAVPVDEDGSETEEVELAEIADMATSNALNECDSF